MGIKIREIAEAMSGQVLNPWMEDLQTNNVSTDTRSMKKGNAFFALPGKLYDGHHFLEEALDKGASVCVSRKGLFYTRRRFFESIWEFRVQI